jgi:hypothetical protein
MSQAPEGYAFCSTCGALLKTGKDGKLPPHIAVGRGPQSCLGTETTKEGVISP